MPKKFDLDKLEELLRKKKMEKDEKAEKEVFKTEKSEKVAKEVENLILQSREIEKSQKYTEKGLRRFLTTVGGGVIVSVEKTGDGIVKTAERAKGVEKVFARESMAKPSGVSRIGGIFGSFEIGEKIGSVLKSLRPERKVDSAVAERLKELKELQEFYKETVSAMEGEEEEWKRVELERPLAERLADIFYSVFGRGASGSVRFFTGLDDDLYRAHLFITPIKYVAMMIGFSLMAGAAVFAVSVFFLPLYSIPFSIIAAVLVLLIVRMYPKQVANRRAGEANRAIPFALRHLATQLQSGIGLFESLTSVANAGYGALSEEFGRVILDINRGVPVEEAFERLSQRIPTEGIQKTVRNMIRAMRTGGDLAETLTILADEVGFELRMKLRDYAQTLNTFGLLYMMLSVVAPVMLMATNMAVSTLAGAMVFSTSVLAILYLILIPFMLFYFGLFVKKMEPQV
ncbi:MAG: type II secretion system F family protein [Candidatus Hydrothermarchaeota archaeon]